MFPQMAAAEATAMGNPYPPYVSVSPNRVAERLNELGDDPIKNLPSNEVLVSIELQKLDQEITMLESSLEQMSSTNSWQDSFDADIKDLYASISKVQGLQCSSAPGPVPNDIGRAFFSALNSLRTEFGSYFRPEDFSAVFAKQSFDSCASAQAGTGGAYRTAIETASTDVKKTIDDQVQIAKEYNTSATKLLQSDRARRTALAAYIDKQPSTASQISQNLPWIMVIIGVSCLAIIAAVLLFSPELQMEWVASGQVIQFVTVMVLLSVIMALGLSKILQEQTLGTLLGGIGGYVLAQGVGRAAARDVNRANAQVAAQRPTTPPHTSA